MIEIPARVWYNPTIHHWRGPAPPDVSMLGRKIPMKHIQTLNGATLKNSAAHGGCGECQTSCQSACKTSCTVANQKCENENK